MQVKLVGAAIDACASTRGTIDTPDLLEKIGRKFEKILYYRNPTRNDIAALQAYFTDLANTTKTMVENKEFPIVVGGDHSCAIGSWSGIADAMSKLNQHLGLIWFDAHMDSHTPQTTSTGNIHGMPLASLLGYGYKEFISILNNNAKVLPKHVVLIGIRSYEEGEQALLNKLGVKIYYDYDVNTKGIDKIMDEAWDYLVSKAVDKIGFTIDLDGFDPKFAPGVGTPEENGIDFEQFIHKLESLNLENKLIGVEITEGNLHFDKTTKTQDCITKIIDVIKIKLKTIA